MSKSFRINNSWLNYLYPQISEAGSILSQKFQYKEFLMTQFEPNFSHKKKHEINIQIHSAFLCLNHDFEYISNISVHQIYLRTRNFIQIND